MKLLKSGFLFFMLIAILGIRSGFAQLPYDSLAFPANYTAAQLKYVTDVEGNNTGKVGVSFRSIGVLYYDGNTWTTFNKQNTGQALPSDSVDNLCLEASEKFWAQTRFGLTSIDTSGLNFYPFPAVNNYVTDIVSLNGFVYISSRFGISVLDTINKTWQTYNTSNSFLPSDTVNSIFVDQSGSMWMGTAQGYAEWNSNGITPHDINVYFDPYPNVQYVTVTPYDTVITLDWWSFRKTGNNFVNLDSLLFRTSVTDEWCDSLAYGFLSWRPELYTRSVRPVVNSKDEIYILNIAIFSGDLRMYVFKSGQQPLYARIPDGETLGLKPSLLKGDSIVYSGYYPDTVLRIVEPSAGQKYLTVSDSLLMNFPNNYSYSIPPSFIGGNQTDIAPNMISTRILNQGDLGWDPVRQVPFYNVPRFSDVSSIWSSAIWLGGYDRQGNLYAAAQTYRQNNSNDFYPGPLDTLGRADSVTRVVFNNIWVTRRTDIDEFRFQFAKGNVTNGTFPVSPYILNWPAYYNNSAFPQKLAPFIDFNGDGLYNPYDGDYPDIKGEQMSWCVYNDDLVKTETNSPPMFAEIHSSAYGYYCPSSQDALSRLIAYTTFYHYDLYNRSDRTYDSCYFGIWSDLMLGNAIDNYVGCNVANNSFYVYNSDSVDEGRYGFGGCPPVQNITFLKGPPAPIGDGQDNNHNNVVDESQEDLGMHSFVFYQNGNDPIGGHPYLKEQYYGYFVPRWLDRSPVTFGGDGLGHGIGATNIPTKFMFPDTTDHNFSTSWTMPGAGLPADNMHGNGSVGPFTWLPDSMVSFDVAYITGPNDLAQNHVLVGQLRELFRSGGIEKYRKFSPPIIGEDSVANAGTIVTYVMPTSADNYIWTVTNGLIVSGQGTNTVEVTWGTAGTGTITAEAFDVGAPCERMQTMEVVVGPPLADPCDGERTVRLYPNPTRSVLQLESVCDTIAVIKVWSMSGQLMEVRRFNGNYNAAWLSTGVYVMEMISSTGEALVRKMFVKY